VLNAQAAEIQNEEGSRDKTVTTRVQPCLKETQWVKRLVKRVLSQEM